MGFNSGFKGLTSRPTAVSVYWSEICNRLGTFSGCLLECEQVLIHEEYRYETCAKRADT